MTENQLKYLQYQEAARHNLAVEEEANRSNTAREAETNRANLVSEAETARHNYATDVIGAYNASANKTAKFSKEVRDWVFPISNLFFGG